METFKHYLFDWGDTLMVDFATEVGPMYKWSTVESVEGANEVLRVLSQTANSYLATNAKASTKADIRKALARVDLDKYIKDVFCFRSVGHEKPSMDFFDHVYKSLNADKRDIVMVGDSLENDIKGALNFGFKAIWLNTQKARVPKEIVSVHSLLQLIGS